MRAPAARPGRARGARAEHAAARARLPPPLRLVTAPPPGALEAFRASNVAAQRQPGFATVTVSLPQGDVTAGQLEALAHLAEAYGDGTVRFSSSGHVLLRRVATGDVPALFARLAAAGLARDGAGSAGDVVACPGAEVCRLAVTRTRDVARLVSAAIREAVPAALAEGLPVHVSGCPNGCSQHHLAAIGLQGAPARSAAASCRNISSFSSAAVGPAGATFNKLAGKVPARRVPDAIAALTSLYLAGAPERRGRRGVLRAGARAREGGARAARGPPARGRLTRGLRRAWDRGPLPARHAGRRVCRSDPVPRPPAPVR